MTSRELPREEWQRKLIGTELQGAESFLPAGSKVVVVEDGDLVVACWSIIQYIHVEGLWVHPSHRSRGFALHRLARAVRKVVERLGAHVALTAALESDAVVTKLLEEHGATKLPGAQYALPMEKLGCRR